ncbi:hypothetical protein A7C99_6120 [Trichophyton rubrum]|uniref:Uncharacterized protein n=1 Tax=Trichophyton rubrum TaxID=5551 RepID=A0A178EUH8_TRIRU|nr:hypothetical protein A7C99_6120 [Trichophyton rubrum]
MACEYLATFIMQHRCRHRVQVQALVQALVQVQVQKQNWAIARHGCSALARLELTHDSCFSASALLRLSAHGRTGV